MFFLYIARVLVPVMAAKKKSKPKPKPAKKKPKVSKAKPLKIKAKSKPSPAVKGKSAVVKDIKAKPVKESKKGAKDAPDEVVKEVQAPPVKQVSPEAQARQKARALARAREALKQKEKERTPLQPTDKAAFEKQLKLAEPKNKLELEYIIHASLPLLYEFITTSSGLSEWFADDVHIKGSVFSFIWDGARQDARLLNLKENKLIRFQWVDRSPNTYFEFRIEKNELTEELSLIITDFAETPEEVNSLEVLWQGQVQRLMKVLGSKI